MESTVLARLISVFYTEKMKPKMNRFLSREEIAIEAGYSIPEDPYKARCFLGQIQSTMSYMIQKVKMEDGQILCAVRTQPGEPIRYGFSIKPEILNQNLDRKVKRVKRAVQRLQVERAITKNLLPLGDRKKIA